jgi:hypothetical protein
MKSKIILIIVIGIVLWLAFARKSSAPIESAKTYVDPSGIFTFNYDPELSVTPGMTNNPFVTVIAPKSIMPGTNFAEAKMTVGTSGQSCTAEGSGEGTKVSGYPFKKYKMNGAGAGNFYETTSYRGIFDGDCYVLEYTIHSTNIGNYPPESGINEFDKAKIENELESVVRSFQFLINSD